MIQYRNGKFICADRIALTVPGEEPALFVICLTQEVGEQSDPADYAWLRDELLAGVELV